MPVQVPGSLYLFQVFPKEPEKPMLTGITQKEFRVQKVTFSKLTILLASPKPQEIGLPTAFDLAVAAAVLFYTKWFHSRQTLGMAI